MLFPLDKVENELDEDKRDEKIRAILNQCEADDPPFLSALLAHADENSVVHIFEILSTNQYQFQWRLKYLRDEWGNEPVPGDKVIRSVPINRSKRDGDLITPREMTKAKKDGSYKGKYERDIEFPLDDKCCFRCGFDDAIYFLNNWGYNKKTDTAVTNKPEYSYEPVDMRDPTKGQKKHVRYWRYAEMDRKDYATLPVVTTQRQGKKG